MAPRRERIGHVNPLNRYLEFSIRLSAGHLFLTRPSTPDISLIPAYRDAFHAGELGTILFRRGKAGDIGQLSIVNDGAYGGVWNLGFTRVR